MIYLDNAATTQPSTVSMVAYEKALLQYGNPSSVHACGRRSFDLLFDAKTLIAKAINAKPTEIYFTASGTDSDNWAILGTISNYKGKHIVTTAIEHSAILEPCKRLEEWGYDVTYVKPQSNGIVLASEIEKAIRKDTVLVSVMWANNEIGTIQPIKEIGAICKAHNVLFHTDAVQAMTTEEINVEECNVDLLSFSSHKVYAPVGLGVLYIRNGVEVAPLRVGGLQQNDRIAGTENYALAYATACALIEPRARTKWYVKAVRDVFVKKVLEEIDGTELVGDTENRLVGNANIYFKGCESEALVLGLDLRGVCASGGSACHAGTSEPSYVITALGKSEEYARSCVRFTFGVNNHLNDVTNAITKLKETVMDIRGRI